MVASPRQVAEGLSLIAGAARHVSITGAARQVPSAARWAVTGAFRTAGRVAPELAGLGGWALEQVWTEGGRLVHRIPGVETGPGTTAPGGRDTAAEEPPRLPGVGDPLDLPAEVEDAVEAAPPGETLAHDELPLPDYDHLTLGSLRARMRSLDVVQLHQLLDYERAHADRLPVVTMFENRLRKLSQPGVEPSGGSPQARRPEAAGRPRGGSRVSPATSPDPAPASPHGVPGNNQDTLRGGKSPSR